MSWSGLPKNLEDKIIPEPMSGCWIWLGGLRDKKDGYGGVGWEGKTYRAHKLVFHLLRYAVPSTVAIDHTCRNRLCCNPDHLEPGTWKENIHRGEGVAARNMKKTHCPQGHEYTSENAYIWKNQRFCRTCHSKYTKQNEQRKKEYREFLNDIYSSPAG